MQSNTTVNFLFMFVIVQHSHFNSFLFGCIHCNLQWWSSETQKLHLGGLPSFCCGAFLHISVQQSPEQLVWINKFRFQFCLSAKHITTLNLLPNFAALEFQNKWYGAVPEQLNKHFYWLIDWWGPKAFNLFIFLQRGYFYACDNLQC